MRAFVLLYYIYTHSDYEFPFHYHLDLIFYDQWEIQQLDVRQDWRRAWCHLADDH